MDRTALIRDCLQEAARLRATGPITDEYLRWRDGTDEILVDLLGPAHELRQAFRRAVGPFQPLDAEGLQIEGEHGMRLRLERGAQVLQRLLGEAA